MHIYLKTRPKFKIRILDRNKAKQAVQVQAQAFNVFKEGKVIEYKEL